MTPKTKPTCQAIPAGRMRCAALLSAGAILYCIYIGIFTGTLTAQTAPARTEPATEEIVHMSEFEVVSRPDDGYGAAMSATASRVAEKIMNLPNPIDVITNEFLEDFNFIDIGDDFNYSSSFGEYGPSAGVMNLRGLHVSKQLRNGFVRVGVIDHGNIERFELIKGPSAAIYGESMPAGLVNIVTKKPKFKTGGKASLTVAENNTYRGDLEFTGPIVRDKTAILLNYSKAHSEWEQKYAEGDTELYSIAVMHKFGPATSIIFDAEYVARDLCPGAWVPTIGTGATANHTRFVTDEEVPRDFNYNGPNDLLDRSSIAYGVDFNHRFNRVWSIKAGGFWSRRDEDRRMSVASSANFPYYRVATRDLGGRRAAYRNRENDSSGAQIDLLAHYWIKSLGLENRTLLTIDYTYYTNTDRELRLNDGTPGYAMFASAMDPYNPDYSWPDIETYRGSYDYYRWHDNSYYLIGVNLRHQTAAWRGRLMVVAGVRYDNVREDLVNGTVAKKELSAPGPWSALKRTTNHLTPNAGINLGVTDNIRAFVNYAGTFFVNTMANYAPSPSLNTSTGVWSIPEPEPNAEGGYGWDYGFKVSMLNEKLKFTIGGFYILRTNMNVTDEMGDIQSVGTILSRGLEFDGSWAINDSYGVTNMKFGYGYCDPVYVKTGADYDLVGRRLYQGAVNHNAYLAIDRKFRKGWLKGWGFNIGIIYSGASYPFSRDGAINTTLPNGEVVVLRNDGRREIKVAGYYSTRGNIMYGWRMGKWDHRIMLSMYNLFDEDCMQRNRNYMTPFYMGVNYRLAY